MKAKLIKTGNDYLLKEYGYGETLAITSGTMEGRKLSLKNCEAIELGYDLDEIIRYETKELLFGESITYARGIWVGFQKALEILGDKKFTENNIDEAFDAGHEMLDSPKNYNDVLKEFIQSLQQTEWDVEIRMEKIHFGGGCYKKQPKLDADGCLILKLTQ